VYHTTGILIPPHDLPRIVHIIGNRIVCSWKRHIDASECPVIIKEPTIFPVRLHINAHDLSRVIDAERLRVQRARKRDINGRKGAVIIEESMPTALATICCKDYQPCGSYSRRACSSVSAT
jgi:hypothetical protein